MSDINRARHASNRIHRGEPVGGRPDPALTKPGEADKTGFDSLFEASVA